MWNPTRICAGCQAEFDCPPITEGGAEYCCEACARAEECSCPEHSHLHNTAPLGSRAGSNILGATPGEL